MPDGNAARVNPLAEGFYTVGDAVRLIDGATYRRVRGWLKGYRTAGPKPVIASKFAQSKGAAELSFLELIEVRFVDHFSRLGVRLPTLRQASERLRLEFDVSRPFASDRVHVVADKADVFLRLMNEIGRKEKDESLVSLTTGNYVMAVIINQSLLPGIEFSRTDHLARRWKPVPDRFDRIIIDPRIAYGRPAGPSGIPTEALRQAFSAESGDYDAVSDWYKIPVTEVRAAIEFEEYLEVRQKQGAA